MANLFRVANPNEFRKKLKNEGLISARESMLIVNILLLQNVLLYKRPIAIIITYRGE